MKYEEFMKADRFGAFLEFVSVKEAKDTGVIPKSYHNIFADECDCGSEMMIARNRKKIMCCNPRCPVKLGHRLSEMLTRFGCPNIGPGISKSIINQTWEFLRYKSHLEVFLLPAEKYPMVLQGTTALDFKYAIEQVKSSELTLAGYIGKLALPKLDKKALDIFEDYNLIEDFVNDYKANGGLVKFLASKGIHDLKIAYYIYDSLPDLYLAEILKSGKVKEKAIAKTYICLTGRLKLDGLPITKENYISWLNTCATAKDGTVLYEFIKSSAKETVPYIVYTTPSTDDKYLVGKRREEDYLESTGTHKQVLIKPEELEEKVKKVVEEYEQGL